MTNYLKRLVLELPEALEILGIDFTKTKNDIPQKTTSCSSKFIIILLILNLTATSILIYNVYNLGKTTQKIVK